MSRILLPLLLTGGISAGIFGFFFRHEGNNLQFNNLVSTARITYEQNISYGNHEKQKLDLCRPKSSAKHPAVLLIHGGGSDKDSFTRICKQLARKGFVAATLNYREEPPPSYTVIHEDNKLALQWLKDKEYVDTDKLGTWGGSLGGYVASMSGTSDEYPKVRCVNNNYGPTDFTDPDLEGSPLKNEFIEKFFGGVIPTEDPQLYIDQSPITHVTSNDAQRWLFTRSINDQLVPRSQMLRMLNALQKVGIQTEFYEYDGSGSGHANRLGLLQARQLLQKRLNFMTGCLNAL